jgi:hypothetical protein
MDNNGYLLSTERIVTLYPQMTSEEKYALHDWEKTYVTGAGEFATSDWPGWKAVVDRLSH